MLAIVPIDVINKEDGDENNNTNAKGKTMKTWKVTYNWRNNEGSYGRTSQIETAETAEAAGRNVRILGLGRESRTIESVKEA